MLYSPVLEIRKNSIGFEFRNTFYKAYVLNQFRHIIFRYSTFIMILDY